jgi:hypothetical protein
MTSHGRVVPWFSWDEWSGVGQLLYSSNESDRISGIEMVYWSVVRGMRLWSTFCFIG